MAEFSIHIADSQVMDVLVALGNMYNYQSKIANPNYDPQDPQSLQEIDNPETLAQFANRMTRQWLAENVKAYKAKVAAEAARLAALEATQLDITDPSL